jgi:hypothetical protein
MVTSSSAGLAEAAVVVKSFLKVNQRMLIAVAGGVAVN